MREVDEAVRQDQAAYFARTYGKWIIGLVVVGLLAFAAYLWWESNSENKLEGRSEELIGALDELDAGNRQTADEELAALAENGDEAAAAIARMLRAGIAIENEDRAAAAELFNAVADDDSAPEPLRNLARIRAVATNYDSLQPQVVIDRLKPLATPGNPWFGSAAELVAMAYLEQGNEELAGPLFASIATDEDVPETLRSRARQMAGLLGYDAVEDVDQTLAEMGAGAAAAPSVGATQ